MRLDFLIIGSMKSGTTSIYSDLAKNPSLFLPENKEPMFYNDDDCYLAKNRKHYEALFSSAKNEQLCGEGSTSYTMEPLYTGVPGRVFKEHGSGLKIIYVVRDPIKRIKSHLYHDLLAGRYSGSPEAQILSDNRYLSISKYSFQISKWVDLFGVDNLKIVKFEDYVANRTKVLKDIEEFLGVASFSYETEVSIKNKSSSKLVPNKYVRSLVTDATWYKNYIKPIVPMAIKDSLAKVLQGRPDIEEPVVSNDVEKKIYISIKNDVEKFLVDFGLNDNEWNEYKKWKR